MTGTKRLSLHGRLRMAAACPDPNAALLGKAADRIEELESWKAAEEAHHHMLKRRIAELEAAIREITGT